MTYCTRHTVALQCHPAIRAQSVRSIQVQVGWRQGGALALTFSLTGDVVRLRLPTPQPSRRADGLWQHTCFEAFIRHEGKPGYYEFNFAPSGAWAAYVFSRYRDGAPLAQDVDPRIAVRRAEQQFELDALMRLECLPLVPLRARLQLALSAVIEDEQGGLSYWALTHPPGNPDFHHPDAFVLELERPEATRVSAPAEGGKR